LGDGNGWTGQESTAMLMHDTKMEAPALVAKERPPNDFQQRAPMVRLLRALSRMLPGEYLKTAFYLNCIDAPRRLLRDLLFSFYRYDHVYAVLREFAGISRGEFSVLEFGTSDGYSFIKLLYATRYLGLEKRVVVHTFDSFEGMPESSDQRDRDFATGDDWATGQFRGNYESLAGYCAAHYSNYQIHRGYFEDSIDAPFLASLHERPPVLIWIDCDYYSSAQTIMTRLIDRIPNGAVIYFDEYDNLNYGSRLTGEARLVHEINSGQFGDNVELIPDLRLSLHSRRLYRFMRIPPNRILVPPAERNAGDMVRRRSDGSPLP
jgi:hypothetical protein